MDEASQGSPSSLHLFDLLQAGNIERTLSEARRILGEAPDDANAHFCLALAHLERAEFADAQRHVDYLLQNYPEDTNSHLAAVSLARNRKRWRTMRRHATEAIRLAPEDPIFHFYAGVADLAELKLESARRHVDRALELDPDNPETRHLSVRLDSIHDRSPADSLRTVEELREALKLDPENPTLHFSLGDIFLDDLDSPDEAEMHYREALRAAPWDRDYQRGLFHAVAKRDLFYRLFSIPSRTFTWLGYLCYGLRYQPWQILILIIAFKLVVFFLLWLALVTVLFWPAGKVYEWLLVSELKAGARTSVPHLRTWQWFHRWPRVIRMGGFLLGYLGVFAVVFRLLEMPLLSGYLFLGVIAAAHFVAVFLGWSLKRLRRPRHPLPPPLP